MTRPSRQSKRFIEFARKVGADESPEAFERTFEKIVPAKHEGDIATPREKKPRPRKGEAPAS